MTKQTNTNDAFLRGVVGVLMRTLEAENPRLRVLRTGRDDYGRVNAVLFATPIGHQFLLAREPEELSGKAASVHLRAVDSNGELLFSYVHYRQGELTSAGEVVAASPDFTHEHQEIYDRVDRICEVVADAAATSDLLL